jgi:hypothetical protein
MNRFRNIFLGLAATMLLVQALLFTSPGQALAGTISEVFVTNTVPNPVPVRDVDNRRPFAMRSYLSLPEGSSFAKASFANIAANTPIPDGKRFVVEFVTVRVDTPQGQAPFRIQITAEDVNQYPNNFNIAVTWQGDGMYNDGIHSNYAGTHMTQFDVFTGVNALQWAVWRNGTTGKGGGDIVLSGYLVDNATLAL